MTNSVEDHWVWETKDIKLLQAPKSKVQYYWFLVEFNRYFEDPILTVEAYSLLASGVMPLLHSSSLHLMTTSRTGKWKKMLPSCKS